MEPSNTSTTKTKPRLSIKLNENEPSRDMLRGKEYPCKCIFPGCKKVVRSITGFKLHQKARHAGVPYPPYSPIPWSTEDVRAISDPVTDNETRDAQKKGRRPGRPRKVVNSEPSKRALAPSSSLNTQHALPSSTVPAPAVDPKLLIKIPAAKTLTDEYTNTETKYQDQYQSSGLTGAFHLPTPLEGFADSESLRPRDASRSTAASTGVGETDYWESCTIDSLTEVDETIDSVTDSPARSVCSYNTPGHIVDNPKLRIRFPPTQDAAIDTSVSESGAQRASTGNDLYQLPTGVYLYNAGYTRNSQSLEPTPEFQVAATQNPSVSDSNNWETTTTPECHGLPVVALPETLPPDPASSQSLTYPAASTPYSKHLDCSREQLADCTNSHTQAQGTSFADDDSPFDFEQALHSASTWADVPMLHDGYVPLRDLPLRLNSPFVYQALATSMSQAWDARHARPNGSCVYQQGQPHAAPEPSSATAQDGKSVYPANARLDTSVSYISRTSDNARAASVALPSQRTDYASLQPIPPCIDPSVLYKAMTTSTPGLQKPEVTSADTDKNFDSKMWDMIFERFINVPSPVVEMLPKVKMESSSSERANYLDAGGTIDDLSGIRDVPRVISSFTSPFRNYDLENTSTTMNEFAGIRRSLIDSGHGAFVPVSPADTRVAQDMTRGHSQIGPRLRFDSLPSLARDTFLQEWPKPEVNDEARLGLNWVW